MKRGRQRDRGRERERLWAEMKEKLYDNDNNIKPIEVNSNNNEYIIFSLNAARRS